MSGKVTPNIIEVRQGDSFTLNLAISNKCQPMDLSGATVLMQVREKDSGNLVFAVSGTPVDVLKGKVALIITPDETSAAVGDYVCDIQITTSGGEVHTIYPADVNKVATFRITGQVTV